MKSILKHLWFIATYMGLGCCWMLSTMIMLNQDPYWIKTKDALFLHAVLLPAGTLAFGVHLMWILSVDWLKEPK